MRIEYKFTVILVILERSGEKSETIFYIPGLGTASFLVKISSFKTFGILPG